MKQSEAEMDRHTIPILRTKLHRPPVPKDHVHRGELLGRLEEDPRRPAILVSAPAGYGKSTLVACWLKECERPGAWFSLDENDNDLQRFLIHFVTAVQTLFPDAVGDTMALIQSPILPPTPVVAATLVNELDRIEQDFILVLDDIHCIQEKGVHDFLNLILRQPPRSMQLALVGRRDPVMPVASLRVKGVLAEVRMRDLRFTVDESTEFLKAVLGREIKESIAAALAEKAEGWVTGLRLAALAVGGTEDLGRGLLELKGTTRYVVDYLISEVLNHQPAGIRGFLLSTSILDRFCAPLCDAVFEEAAMAGEETVDGQAFIDWLWKQNLFIIPLDMENRWFRYHHLFGDLLRAQLRRTMSREEIAGLHSRASAWCEDQASIEESIHHALEAGDAERAADIVECHRDAEFDANRWYVVNRWLEMLPEEITQHRLKLLLTEARVLNDRFRLMDIPPVLERAQALVESQPTEPLDQGELFYFLGFLQYWQGDGRSSQDYFDRAIELVPEIHVGYVRAQLELFVGLTAHINGRKDEAIQRLTAWIDTRNLRTGLLWQRLTYGLAIVHLLSGELAAAHRESRKFLDDGIRTGSRFIETWGEYLLGVVAFHRHDLAEASRHFSHVVANRYVANTRAAIDSMAGIAIVSQLLGRPDEADESVRLAGDHARWSEDSTNLEVVLACEARIALLRGDLDAAGRWQRGFRMPLHAPSMIFFLANPSVTECRVLAALGTEAGLAEAAAKLQHLRQETSSLHNTCQAIDVIALQAMVAHLQGRLDQALDLLKQAVDLSGPEGWIRPFVELGSPMAGLLHKLLEQDPSTDHVGEILDALPNEQPPPTSRHELPQAPPDWLVEPLTHRELDVLELLAKRLQNKEIAEELSISSITVKSHLRNIYQKLQVTRRREAVERAAALRLLD